MTDGPVAYHTEGGEDDRLADPRNHVEWARTLEILEAVLPPPPAWVLDAGGGTGRYAAHLDAVATR